MNAVTYLAFVDEMEKIALLQNLGTRILHAAKSAPRSALNAAKAAPGALQGGVQNAGKAVGAFSTPVESLKKGFHTATKDFKTLGKGQKALLGLGLLASGNEALAKNDPMGRGRSKVERGLTAAGDQVGGLIGTPFGLSGGLVGGLLGRKAGSLVGKGVDLARGYKKPQAAPPGTNL